METYPSLIQYLEDTGLAHRITSTTGGGHASGSYHYAGQAIDAADIIPSANTPELVAIQHSWLAVEHQLAELIGPDPDACVKNGKRYRYGADTMADHGDHIHTASTVKVTHPEPASDERKKAALIVTALLSHPTWNGYLEVQEDGGVFSFGAPLPPEPYSIPGLGGPPLSGMDRIIDAAVTATGQGYWLMGANGNVYSFGDARYYGGRQDLPSD